MSLLVEQVPITTLPNGTDLSTVRAGGCIVRAIRVLVGTLSMPDITITEQPSNTTILAVTGLAADASYVPLMVGQDHAGADITGSAVPIPVVDRIQIAIAGGGDTKTGQVSLLLER